MDRPLGGPLSQEIRLNAASRGEGDPLVNDSQQSPAFFVLVASLGSTDIDTSTEPQPRTGFHAWKGAR
jgi:hypothetical protein